MKMTKEKMVLKVMVEPKEIPCHDCVKGCMGDEFMRCKKLKAHNKKIIAKGYDYDKAVEVMAKAICLSDDDGGCKGKCNVKCSTWKYSVPAAEAALKALLGVEK